MNSEDISNNVAHLLDKYVKLYPDKIILIDAKKHNSILIKNNIEHNTITYYKFSEKINKFVDSLKKLGIKKGDRVLVMVPMNIELYIILISILKIGAEIVVINPSLGLKKINTCCGMVSPKVFICIRKARIFSILCSNFKKIKINIVVDGRYAVNAYSYYRLIKQGENKIYTETVNKVDNALITFTSGSTGMPKSMCRTHEFLMIQNNVVSKSLGYKQGDAELTALPVFILNNLANNIISLIPYFGDKNLSKMNPGIIVDQIFNARVTRAIGSPFFFESICDYCIRNDISFDFIKEIYTGGGPVTLEILQKIKKVFNCTVIVAYGSTEAEPISKINAEEIFRLEHKPGFCVGYPIDEIEIKIIQIKKHALDFTEIPINDLAFEKGEIGEIIVKGGHVNRTYFNNQEAVKMNKIPDYNKEFWHRTGDTGFFDESGRLWITGRVSANIFRNGNYIHPVIIEDKINQLSFVKKSAVIEINNMIILAVELLPGNNRSVSEKIKSIIRNNEFIIDRIKIIKKIPLDKRHNTKIDYGTLIKILNK